MVIKRKCAWCGRYLGTAECQCPPHQTTEELITHSICPECLEKALAEIDSAPAKTNKPNE